MTDLAKTHEHDFGTGRAPCTICRRTAAQIGVNAGGRNVTPGAKPPAKDDGYRVGEQNDCDEIVKVYDLTEDGERPALAQPMGIFDGLLEFATGNKRTFDNEETVVAPAAIGSRDLVGDYVEQPLNRTDVVAHGWGIERRVGEDDASLATRVRREASRPGNSRRPPVPPHDWVPPQGYRLGDDWIKIAWPGVPETYDQEPDFEDRAVIERPMKRLNP